ncbi:hypothetical protein D8X55_04970, partial [Malacoplasma penetrans]|uniref:DUF3713 domain-containing protein n=1 Tax=Malacoplasma penetrans TaxID=28227 RepID=UPI0010133BC0
STFSTDLFANLYLSVTDSNGNYVNPTVEILQQALEESSNTSGSYKFSFSSNALNKSVDTYVASEYASFQKFIFDQWVQSENPFMINYVQWSYSNPESGLDAVYNKDAIGMSATSTTASASYTFPYFNNTKTNDANSSVLKFENFINDGTKTANAYADVGTKSISLGLTNLNRTDLYSDDTSASYKLVINTSSYSDLQAPLALGSTYLFDTAFTTSTTGGSGSQQSTTGIDYTERSKLTKTASTNTSTGSLDPITSNFIVADKETLKNSTLSASGTPSNGTTYIPHTQIADTLVKKILSDNAYTSLTSTTGGSNNNYNSSNGLYAIDAFIPSNTNLNNVLFLRDSTGVYAITLDGESYIAKATSLSDAKTRAGNVVLYRHLQNKTNSNAGLSIDLSSSLSTFFTNNKDWLVYKYATTQSNQKLFDFNFLSESARNVLSDLSNYLYIVDRYQRIEAYQEAVYSNKATYSGNYGTKTVLNGFASQFPYTFTDSANSSSATIGYYKQLSTLKLENPFGTSDSSVGNYFTTDPYDTTSGIYKKLNDGIITYVNSLSINPLTSSFAGFQYSEYILTNDFFLNQAILAVGSDGNLLSDLIKKNILVSSIQEKHSGALTSTDYMNYDSYQVKSYSSSVGNSNSSSEDVSQYINSALSNYFFNSTFDSSSNKWVRLKQPVYTDYSDGTKSTYQTLSYTNLDTYRRDMWVNGNLSYTSSSADNYVSFLTVLATIDYLLDNGDLNFLSQLSSKLSDSDTNLSFLVWEGSSDGNLETGKDIAKTGSSTSSTATYLSDATKLLYGDSTDNKYTITNVANSQSSAYYPSKSNTNTYVENNNNNSAFTDSTTSSNYYTHVADMKSFQGIQTNTSSSNISSFLTTTLFTSPTTYNDSKTGLLYGYASDRESLANQVGEYSDSQAVAFASTISKLFGIDTSSVTNGRSLASIIRTDKTNIPEAAFQPRNGYINSGTFYKDASDSVNNVNYGSYVLQLSSSNLSSTNAFITYLQQSFNSNDPATKPNGSATPGTPSTTNNNAENQAKSVFWNLVVQLATDSSVQGTAISSLLTNTTSNRKVTVYDVRLNNQLGSRWASNYKDQSSS